MNEEQNVQQEEQANQEEIQNDEPTAEELKAQLQKLTEERDNYKKGLLLAKKRTLSLEEDNHEGKKEDTPKEDDESEWDEDSKKFQKETLTKAEQIAKEAVEKQLSAQNEQRAINKFLENNPEASDDETWKEIVRNYRGNNGKTTVKSIMEDLDDAYTVVLKRTGKLQERFEKAKREGEQEGIIAAKKAELAALGNKGGSGGNQEGENVNPVAAILNNRMPKGFVFKK